MNAKAPQAMDNSCLQGIGYMPSLSRLHLRDRVGKQAAEASRQSHKAERLQELAYLLDKNPEIARILDLMEDVRG